MKNKNLSLGICAFVDASGGRAAHWVLKTAKRSLGDYVSSGTTTLVVKPAAQIAF